MLPLEMGIISYDRSTTEWSVENGSNRIVLGFGSCGSALGRVDRLKGDGQGIEAFPEGFFRIRGRASHSGAPDLEILPSEGSCQTQQDRVRLGYLTGGSAYDRALRTAIADLAAIGFDRLTVDGLGD